MTRETMEENIGRIRRELAEASEGRYSVPRLMAVTKTKPAEIVTTLIGSGVRCFGENYPDETAGKIDAFRTNDAVRLAMIGHLQSRKAKIVADLFDEYHSVDNADI